MTTFINPYAKLDRSRERKMVFYGRVSTEHEAQLAALENQIQWYDDQAKYHPNWTVIDKYIDEGITGTQAKKRPAFLRMIEDAKAGKFDLIVTREVCRFARNTVDTLVTTRELKDIGVEVYFVEDNIWTMDGDGELRLAIMATLAQEESRKVSERVRAGQQISREKGRIYGSGNVLGYDRVGDTYVINPDQAETVRMIYDMYLRGDIGAKKIAQELTRLGRLNASGNDHWDTTNVSRILKNQTYMGYMAYGKSHTNNYLEQKRRNNHDASTYMLVKCGFPPIVTEEEWYRCQEIIRSRTGKTSASAVNARTQPTHGKPICFDLWTNKLRCKCGSSFRKNRWHKNKGKEWSYGYQCYNQINRGSAKKRIEAGADPTGYCDMGMIADWKLDMMGEMILERIWEDRRETIELVCRLLKESYRADKRKSNADSILAKIEKLKSQKSVLTEMRTGGEITKEEFAESRKKFDDEIQSLEAEYGRAMMEDSGKDEGLRLDEIIRTLNELADSRKQDATREMLKKLVARVVPEDKTHYRWYMNLDGTGECEIDAEIEGRKNHAVVSIDGEGPQTVSQAVEMSEKTYSAIQPRHRLLSQLAGNKIPETDRVHADKGRCRGVCQHHDEEPQSEMLEGYKSYIVRIIAAPASFEAGAVCV